MTAVPAVPAALLGAATIALVVVLVAAPADRANAVAAYLLLLGAVGLWVLARALVGAWPTGSSDFERALRRQGAERMRVRELVGVENDVITGATDPSDFERRLRPLLREIAVRRLASRHGIDAERQPEAARRLLGAEVWELVFGRAEAVERRFRRGATRAALRTAVEELERI